MSTKPTHPLIVTTNSLDECEIDVTACVFAMDAGTQVIDLFGNISETHPTAFVTLRTATDEHDDVLLEAQRLYAYKQNISFLLASEMERTATGAWSADGHLNDLSAPVHIVRVRTSPDQPHVTATLGVKELGYAQGAILETGAHVEQRETPGVNRMLSRTLHDLDCLLSFSADAEFMETLSQEGAVVPGDTLLVGPTGSRLMVSVVKLSYHAYSANRQRVVVRGIYRYSLLG